MDLNASQDPLPVSPEIYRDALGRFATGVTVVTVASGRGIGGFTANAFSALSIDPPLILVCSSYRSNTYETLRGTGRFAVNLLSDSQADLARRFARPGASLVAVDDWRHSESGLPVLDDALALIECRYHCEYEGGDHAIVVGAVESVTLANEPVKPLLYYRGELGPIQFS